LDEKAASILDADSRRVLGELQPRLADMQDWTVAGLEKAVRIYAEEKGIKLGKAAQPLRAALTGRGTSPGVFDVLHVLGREESLARIADQSV
jgi:glutamyl-tRNA synthetase